MGNKKQYFTLKRTHDREYQNIPTTPGIYLGTSYDPEINKTYFYVGQAKDLRERHFHYGMVIKGLTYPTKDNEYSLRVHQGQEIKDENGNVIGHDRNGSYSVIESCFQDRLNEREQFWIHEYLCKDNFITRNNIHGHRDKTTSNKKRLDKIENKMKSTIRHSLSKLNMDTSESQLHIYVKENKDGSLNKLSQDAFDELLEFINEIKLVEK